MTLQAHTLKPAVGAKHRRKIIGRGNASGHGTSSTRGGKGQTARSGGSRGLQLKSFKQLLQSTPKLRGFHSHIEKPVEVYLSDLEKHFSAGDKVEVKNLVEKNIVGDNTKSAKVVDKGELKKKLTLVGIKATKGALEKIQKVGGEIK